MCKVCSKSKERSDRTIKLEVRVEIGIYEKLQPEEDRMSVVDDDVA